MHLELQWQTNPRTSILHAMRLLSNERPVIDHAIISLLAPRVPPLRQLGLTPQFWDQLLSTASRDAELSLLVREATQRSRLEIDPHEVSRLLEGAEQHVMSSELNVREELRLRQRPLREIWEASGPGMLFQIARWTKRPMRSRLEVDGLLPLSGGFGRALAQAERVQIELVLTNPTAEVPEVIRLAWLIAQLSIPSHSHAAADRLALVPCCLAAAEQLGIAQCQPASLAKSLRQWRAVGQGEDELGATLHQWWNDRDKDSPWSQAAAPLQDLLPIGDIATP